MKKRKYYHFKTFTGEEIIICHYDYFKAEEIATQKGAICQYIGWTEEDEKIYRATLVEWRDNWITNEILYKNLFTK